MPTFRQNSPSFHIQINTVGSGEDTFRVDHKITKGLRWGELLIGVAFVFINIGAGFLGNHSEAQFYSRFWFAWMTFAAFVGMTAFLGPVVRNLRILPHVFVSLVILAGIGFCLLDQHFFASPGIKNWIFDLAAIIGLVGCVRANRHFAAPVRLVAIPLTVITLCVTLFWALGSGCQIFLPVLFVPNANLSAARSTFMTVFFSGILVSILVSAVIVFLGSRRRLPLERWLFVETPVSRKSKIRMALSLVAFIAVAVPAFYFIPGTSSGSGGASVEIFLKGHSEQARVSVTEVDRYLREIGLEPSDKQDFPFRQNGLPVAWYRYPLSKSRAVVFWLWRDPERDGALVLSHRYSKVSVSESRKMRKLMSVVRLHFHDLWIKSQSNPKEPG